MFSLRRYTKGAGYGAKGAGGAEGGKAPGEGLSLKRRLKAEARQ
jgi:hypothetical protein